MSRGVCGAADTEQGGSQSCFRGRSNAAGLLIKCFLIPCLCLSVPVWSFFFFLLPVFPPGRAEESLDRRRSERPAMIAQFHLNAAPSLTDHPFDSSTPHKPPKRAHTHIDTQTRTHSLTRSLLHAYARARTHTRSSRRRLSGQRCPAAPRARSAPMNEAGGRFVRLSAEARGEKRNSTSVQWASTPSKQELRFERRNHANPKFKAMQSLFFFFPSLTTWNRRHSRCSRLK